MRLGVEAVLVDGRIMQGDMEVADGHVVACGLASPSGRGIAVPGFIDLQSTALPGSTSSRLIPTDTGARAKGLLETGVTSYLPTLITTPEDKLAASLREVPKETGGARILGVHLEEPFLSRARLGAHPVAARRDPDGTLLDRLLNAGLVRLMTLAPELPGADHVIRMLLGRGVTVSFGHSDATAAEADAGFDLGVQTVTHLYNAMRPFHHRDPGIAGAALAREDVVVQVILDGDALMAANGDARVAIVSLLGGIEADEARARLGDAGQSIRRALGG